jgi:hypothetical protein
VDQHLDHDCVDADDVCACRRINRVRQSRCHSHIWAALSCISWTGTRIGSGRDRMATPALPVSTRNSIASQATRESFVIAAHGKGQFIQIGDLYWTWMSVRDLLLPVASKPILVILDAWYSVRTTTFLDRQRKHGFRTLKRPHWMAARSAT